MTDPNITAFLSLIGRSEGTSTCKGTKNDGYDVINGGQIFTSYADHPRVLVHLKHADGSPVLKPDGTPLNSTAAGKFQILAHNFDVYKAQLHLPDFSPVSQDAIAVQMMKECHAISMLQDGNIQGAISACASRWASFPGNSYGQHQHSMDELVDAYESLGGLVA